MHLQKLESRKTLFFVGVFPEGQGRKNQDPEPHPDPLVRGMDPRIRIRTKMSRIHNTAFKDDIQLPF